jgi:hypothetical protein
MTIALDELKVICDSARMIDAYETPGLEGARAGLQDDGAPDSK